MNNGLVEAISAIEKERGIDEDILYEAIHEALKKAYRNHYGTEGNVRAEVDRETGDFKVFSQREVVEEVTWAILASETLLKRTKHRLRLAVLQHKLQSRYSYSA